MNNNTSIFFNGRVKILAADITSQHVDAIVNAANSTLLGGGGVDGAIHSKGGRSIYEECLRIRRELYQNGLPPGKAVITGAGALAAKFVIHAVGPVYGRHQGGDAAILAEAYANCLALAKENHLESIAFPSISTGAFGYPKREAAKICSGAIKNFIENDTSISEIRLIFYSEADSRIFLKHCGF